MTILSKFYSRNTCLPVIDAIPAGSTLAFELLPATLSVRHISTCELYSASGARHMDTGELYSASGARDMGICKLYSALSARHMDTGELYSTPATNIYPHNTISQLTPIHTQYPPQLPITNFTIITRLPT